MASENSNSHAGRHDDFKVEWKGHDGLPEGWYWYEYQTGRFAGPFHTSQAAYDNRREGDEGYQCHVITLR